MDFSKELSDKLLYQSENELFHAVYSKELAFYNAVKTGNMADVKKMMSPLNSEGLGKLSENRVNNMRYHLIVTIAMITRFCMEGGMPSETAYTLSDLYIQKADRFHTEDALTELHRTMIFDYTSRMQKIHEPSHSKIVTLAMEYVNKNIRTPLLLEDIAQAARVSTCYLSTLFKKETGETLTTYIQRTRIEEAKNMLKFTDTEFIDISNYLCFSSHSHFIAVFKKYAGITPKEYRDKYYRKKWEGEIPPPTPDA